MKMNFKYLTLFAAACAVSFSSCSSDDGNSPLPNNGGDETSFSITLSSPTTYNAVATDPNADAYELKFTDVDVFVFMPNGSLESHTRLSQSDFTRVKAANGTDDTDKWEMKVGTRIASTTGEKHVYVGLNLSTDVVNNIKKDGPNGTSGLTSIFDLERTDGISMFNSGVIKEVFVLETGGSPQNIVTVPVSRLLSKVIFYEPSTVTAQFPGVATYTVTDESGDTASDLHFTVGNVNNTFFHLPDADSKDPNFDNTDMTTYFLHPGINLDPYQQINKYGKAIADANRVYASENTITDGLTIQGAATYGVVRVKYKPAKVRTNATDDTEKTFSGTTFYKVVVNKVNMLYDSKAEALAKAGGKADEVCEYTNGFAYYPVFLQNNKITNASKYSVLRNTAYRVTVNSISGLGSHTDQPNDKPKGIIDPKDPIEKSTNIDVNIEIEDWVMVDPQNVDL